MTGIIDLPQELILSIFTYLDIKSIACMRQVSRLMFQIGTDRGLIHKYIQNNKIIYYKVGLGMLEHYLKMSSKYISLEDICYERKTIVDKCYIKMQSHYHLWSWNINLHWYQTFYYTMITLLLKYNADYKNITQAFTYIFVSNNEYIIKHDEYMIEHIENIIQHNENIIILFLNAGANPNLINNIFKYLLVKHDCDLKEHQYKLKYLRLLLQAGLNPNKQNENENPICIALKTGEILKQELKMLLNIANKFAVKQPVFNSCTTTLSHLISVFTPTLSHLISVSTRKSPLNILIRNASKWNSPMKIFKRLLILGADPNIIELGRENIHNSLYMICVYGPIQWKNPLDICKILIDKCKMNIQQIAQHIFITPQNKNVLNNRNKYQFDTNLIHKNLIHKNKCDISHLLLKSGLDPNEQNTILGQYPLHTAVIQRQTHLVSLLLQYGANPNMLDTQHNTPLHKIIITYNDTIDKGKILYKKNVKQIINELLIIGANPEIKNRDGISGKDVIIKYLKNLKINIRQKLLF